MLRACAVQAEQGAAISLYKSAHSQIGRSLTLTVTSIKEERKRISHNPKAPTVTVKKRPKYGVLPEEPLAVAGYGDPWLVVLT